MDTGVFYVFFLYFDILVLNYELIAHFSADTVIATPLSIDIIYISLYILKFGYVLLSIYAPIYITHFKECFLANYRSACVPLGPYCKYYKQKGCFCFYI